MIVRKAALDISEHIDNKNEVPAEGVVEPKNSHNPSCIFYTTTIGIDNNLDVEE